MSKETKKETEARQHLETQLMPGEELLACCGGTIAGLVSNQHYTVGLTAERLILLPLKRGRPSGQALSFWREFISSMSWSGGWSRLKIKLPKGGLSIACAKRYWKKCFKGLVEAHSGVPIPLHDDTISNQRRLEQVRVLQGFSLIASAQAVGQGVQPDASETGWGATAATLVEKRVSLRVGAGFLVVNSGLLVLATALLAVSGEPSQPLLLVAAAIDIIIGINLWRGQAFRWADWAIVRAAVGLVLFAIVSLLEGAVLAFVSQAAFSGSVLLVLTGESKRSKTWAAIGVYVIGYLGVSLVLFFSGITDPQYVEVWDDTETLVVEIPVEWSVEVDGRPYLDDDGTFLAAGIQASSNLEDFYNTYATPGVEFGASRVWAALYDEVSLLDVLQVSYDCIHDGRHEYDDGLYSGLYDLYVECGDVGSVIVELVAMPADRSFIIFLQVQAVTDADLDAYNHILETFALVGELP